MHLLKAEGAVDLNVGKSRNGSCQLQLVSDPFQPKALGMFKTQEQCTKKLVERKGDWVCKCCQNLNFAFRKNCNRCKTGKS